MSENYRAMRPECRDEFERIHKRIDKRDKTLETIEGEVQTQAVAIARTSEDVIHMAKSISSLTKALWGVAVSLMATLFGFVLWYIQSL